MSQKPKLRALEAFRAEVEGKEVLALRDPEGLSPNVLFIPEALVAIIAALDGEHSIDDILTECRRPGDAALKAKIHEILATLEKSLFLEGPGIAAARKKIEDDFRSNPVRPAAHAGKAYEGSREPLRAQLDGCFTGLAKPPRDHRPLRGLISPHIDYRRGAAAYGWAYGALAAHGGADLYVILGTCHAGTRQPFAGTLKPYETPFGRAEVDAKFVGELSKRSKLDLCADELSHRTEHSIELQVVFLQHSEPAKRPLKIVPIMTSFCHELMARGKDPAKDPGVERFCRALSELIAEDKRRICVVAGADLAHMGTRYGDPKPLTAVNMEEIAAEDRALLERATACDAAGFYKAISADNDKRRICGFSPIYTLLRVLGKAEGRLLHYGQWPDPDGLVSFAAAAFT